MSRYECTLLYDASNGVNVEAESVEEAIERAYKKAPHVGLCHECSGELDVGDLIGMIVYHDGKEVADTSYGAVQLQAMTAERDALRAEVERLQRIIDSKPECTTCGGTGSIEISGPHWQSEFQPPEYEMGECDMCGGSGKAIAEQPDADTLLRVILDAQFKKPSDIVTGTSNWAGYMAEQIIARDMPGKEDV